MIKIIKYGVAFIVFTDYIIKIKGICRPKNLIIFIEDFSSDSYY